ncbi:ATP-binding protein [Yinghuangia sp. ASG 101]|uniref:ATP-binding protein n=1 Tax=Yinghuangia sp. ASG 101 TaxID=2896848 RepID=UPI001E4B1776|nr:ATP-binding protein [Yinghuangia sp. ASG 101]UGQ10916.1 ATP-binding protein [Yinghuangia sp. ASG 101]
MPPSPNTLLPTRFTYPLQHLTVPLTTCARPTAVARRAVEDAYRSRSPEQLDDIVLGVNELVVNAVEHTPGPLRLIIEVHPRHAVARVCDPLPDITQVNPKPPTPMSESGRGLHLLTALAEMWFVQPTQDGKAVCAAFRIPRQHRHKP